MSYANQRSGTPRYRGGYSTTPARAPRLGPLTHMPNSRGASVSNNKVTKLKPGHKPAPALDTPTDLDDSAIKAVSQALNGLLATSYALYIKTKNFHWHMSGPHFRDYHL